MKKRVLVKGPALSRSGYGEQTRFALRALREHEDRFDIFLINIPWGHTGYIINDDEERQWLDFLLQKTMQAIHNKQPFDISLQVTIPNEWEKIAPVNIGYTAGIETTKVAPQWIVKGAEMDKIIVVSNHSKQVYETTTCEVTNQQTGESIPDFRCETPIEVVNYPVRNFEPSSIEGFKLDFNFNFLSVAQWGPRKNLDNTITWFLEEFADEKVGLVLKTNIAKDCLIDRLLTEQRLKNLLSRHQERKCKVYLLHGILSEEEMTWLYQHKKLKAMVSLTHGEGFGLPLFEAAYNGMPIIAPVWSGQADFLYGENKKGKIRPMVASVGYTMQPVPAEAVWDGVIEKDSMWAHPNEKDYKKRLREVYKSYDRHLSVAKKLKKNIIKNFKEEVAYQEFADKVWTPSEEESSWGETLEKIDLV